jgi:methylisocitrate lyase
MDLIKRCKSFRLAMKGSCIMLPGAFNGLVGRAIAQRDFKGCYLSGAAVSASYGVPDIGLLTVDHFTNRIKEISLASGLPILADADTGFGEAESVTRTVVDYFLAGATGLHLEDQVFPKRCGHLDGKELISTQDFANKIIRAVEASKQVSDGQFVICARTDAKGVYGLEEAIKRCKAYIEAGADMIFPEGLATEEEFAALARELRATKKDVLLLANMTEFGKTPIIPFERFEQMGYSCVIYPVTTLRVAMRAVTDCLDDLKKTGSVKTQLQKMQTRQELYDTLEYTPGKEWYYPTSAKK